MTGVLDQLIARADVFAQNLAPGAAGRLGLEPRHSARGPAKLLNLGLRFRRPLQFEEGI